MINLVPGVVRKAIIKEYWVRVGSVFLAMFAVAALLCGVFALPVYVLINSQVDAFAASASEAAKRVADFNISTEVLTKANTQAQKLIEQKNVVNFSTVYTQIEKGTGAGTVIRGYEFTRKDNDIGTIVVMGRSDTRQALADFHATLKQQSWVEKVDLPISNLAKEKDIDFTMTITYKKN